MLNVYGSLGANELPVAVVSGIQQLSPGTADDVLTFLNTRVTIPDPVQAPKGIHSFLAVTMVRFNALGYKTTEATTSSGSYIASLPKGNYALANINDVLNLTVVEDFHFTVAKAEDVPFIAGPGSPLAVLSPLVGAGSGGATETPAKEEKKFSVLTPILGAGIGLLVGGPVGAAVGAGIGLGVEVLRAA